MKNQLGERLKARIADLGISQAEAARRCGLSPQRLNNYTSGRSPPDVETLVGMAVGLKCSTDYLLGLSSGEVPDISGIVRRLLELEGLDEATAIVIGETSQEALRLLLSLPVEGDADLRSRIVAQAAWQIGAGSKLPQ